jgi:hypothetical protein
MDLLSILVVMVRRWYVSLPVLLVTFVAAVYLQASSEPRYEARGSVLLTEPQLDPSGLPASVVTTSHLIDRVEAGEAATAIGEAGGDFVIRGGDDGFEVVAIAASAEEAQSAARSIQDQLVAAVEDLQVEAEIPQDERLRVSAVSPVAATEQQTNGAFQATGTVFIEDPTADAMNPFAANNLTGRVLEVAVMSDAGRALVAERTSPGVSFRVTQNLPDAAPILEIATYGSVPDEVLAAFDQVATVVDEELDRRQARAEVPSTRRVRVEALAVPRSVVDVSPPVSRAVATIVALGLLLTPMLVVAVENLAARRRRDWEERLDDPWLWAPNSTEPKASGSRILDDLGDRPPRTGASGSSGSEVR